MPSRFLPLVVVIKLLTALKLVKEAVPVDPLLTPMVPLEAELVEELASFDL